MPSVDNRVVEMRFENKQFESGVKTSLSTLERLKKALNFENSVNTLSALGKSATGITLGGLSNTITAATKSFSVLGSVGSRVLENLTDSAMNLGSKMMSAVSGSIVEGGKSRAMNLAQANFQMEGLLKDSKKVEAVMNSVKESVSGTAYGLDAAANTASQFLASGLNDTKEMEKALKAVTGVAAMTNSSFEDIGNIFATVSGNGRLMGDQLLQFSSRGLNAAAILAKQLNVTEAEIRDMVTKGQIDFKTFYTAMNDAFGAQAKKANETFNGSLANMKAALSRIGADFISPAMENLIPVFNALQTVIDDVHEQMKPFIETTSKGMKTLSNIAVGLIKSIDVSWIEQVLRIISNIGYGLFGMAQRAGEKLKNLIPKDLASSAKKVLDIFESLSETFKKTFGILTNEGSVSLKATKKKIKEVTKPVAELDKVAKKVINGDFGNGDERKKSLAAAGYAYKEVQNRVNELLGFSKKYEEASKKEETQDKKTSAAKEELAKTTEKVAEKSKVNSKAFDNIAKAVAGVVSAVKIVTSAFSSFYKIILNPVLKVFFSSVLSLSSMLGDKLVRLNEYLTKNNSFDKFFTNIKNGFLGIISGVSKPADALAKAMSAISKAGGDALTSLSKFSGIKKIIDLFKSFTGKPTAVGQSLSGVGKAVKEIEKTVAPVSIVTRALNKLKELCKPVVDAISSLSVVKKITDLFSSFFKKTEPEQVGLKATAKDVKNIGETIKDAAKPINTFSNLLSILSKSSEKTSRSFTKLSKVNKVLETFNKLLGKTSSKDNTITTAEKTAKSLGKAVTPITLVNEALKKIKPICAEVVDAFKQLKIVEDISKFFDKLSYQKMLNAPGEAVKSVADQAIANAEGSSGPVGRFSKILEGLVNVFNRVYDGAKGVFGVLKKVAGVLKDTFSGALNQVGKSIKTAFKNIADAFNNLDVKNVKKVGKILSLALTVLKIVNVLKKIRTSKKGLEDIPNSINGVFTSLADTIDTYNKSLKVDIIDKMATAVLKIAGAMFILSTIPSEKLANVAIDLAIVLFAFSRVIKSFGQEDTEALPSFSESVQAFVSTMLTTMSKALKFASIGALFVGIAVAIGLLVKTIFSLMELKKGDIAKVIGAISLIGVLGLMLIGAAVLLNKFAKSISLGTAVAIAAMGFAVSQLANVVKLIGTMDADQASQGIKALLLIMLGLAAVTASSSLGSGKTMLALAVAMALLANSLMLLIPPLAILGALPFNTLAKGLGTIAIVLGGLIVAANMTENLSNGIQNVLTLSAAVIVLAAALKIIGSVSDSAGPIIAMIVVLGVAMAGLIFAATQAEAIAGGLMTICGSLISISAAFLIFGGGVALFGLGVTLFGEGLSKIGTGLVDLANGMVESAKTMTDNQQTIAEGVTATFDAMADGVTQAKPSITKAIASFIGSACEAIVENLPRILTTATMVLKTLAYALIVGVVDLAEVAIFAIIVALNSIAKAIIDNTDLLMNAIKNVLIAIGYFVVMGILELLEPIISAIPVVGKKFSKFLSETKKNVQNEMDYNSGYDSIKDYMKGQSDAAEEGGNELINKTDGTISEVGNVFTDNLSETKAEAQAAWGDGSFMDFSKLTSSMDADMNGMLGKFKEYVPQFGDSAEGIPEGIINALDSGKSSAGDSSAAMGDNIDKRFRGILGISSPSAVFKAHGANIVAGLSQGITKNSKAITKPITSMAKTLSNAFKGKGSAWVSSGKSMVDGLGNGIKQGTGKVLSTTKKIASDSINAIKKESSKYTTTGREYMTRLRSGISSMAGAVAGAVRSVASSAVHAAEGKRSEFYSIGVNMMNGLKAGIMAKASEIAAAAASVVRSSINRAKQESKQNSPSKEFMWIGEGFGEGLVKGIKNMTAPVAAQSAKFVREGLNSSKNAVNAVLDAISADMDSFPVITPVLDTSLIAAGAQGINGLFSNYQVNAGLGTIGVAMRNRQNSSPSSEVVSAINKLKSELENAPHNIYNVNGVTYDDGSNVSMAVKDLISAARVERRR